MIGAFYFSGGSCYRPGSGLASQVLAAPRFCWRTAACVALVVVGKTRPRLDLSGQYSRGSPPLGSCTMFSDISFAFCSTYKLPVASVVWWFNLER